MSIANSDSFWAHLMWQKHGMRFQEFFGMEESERLIYIASELLTWEKAIEKQK